MPRYFLAKHAFVCAVGADVVVLDLKHDRYVAFERDFWDPIARDIGGWPALELETSAPQPAPDADALSQLMESGLLTADDHQGKDATPAAIELPSTSLIEDFRVQPPSIRAGHVLSFIVAVCAARLRLRFQPIEKVVSTIRQSRQSHAKASDPAAMRDLTEVFRRLRPMLLTSRSHCLLESLALLNFLSRYDIHPTWVFGVHTAPFSAHCWLQLGEIACNDPLDHIRRYTPIMVV